MAKVSCNYIPKIPVMSKEELYKPLVFVVDMINGFAKEGALSDQAILEIVPAISHLLDVVRPSVFICDAHDLDAREFAAFPLHCIKNTEESMVIDELKPYAKKIINKNSTNAFMCEEMQCFLKDELPVYEDIVITGCCSDICVMQFALSLQTYFNEHACRQRVIVPINMIETYHIDGVHEALKWNEIACDIMLSSGINVVEMK